MGETVLILVTCGSKEAARKIAESLVRDRLAACVNVVSGVESCYRWEGELQWDSECLLLIKTREEAVEGAHDRVLELHSYDVPEFVVMRIDEGSKPYLDWIAESVG